MQVDSTPSLAWRQVKLSELPSALQSWIWDVRKSLFRQAGDDYSLVQTLPTMSAGSFTNTSLKKVKYFKVRSLQQKPLVEWSLPQSPPSTAQKQSRSLYPEVPNTWEKSYRFRRWYTRQEISCILPCIHPLFRRLGSKQLRSRLEQELRFPLEKASTVQYV